MKRKNPHAQIDSDIETGYNLHIDFPKKGLNISNKTLRKSREKKYTLGIILSKLNIARCLLYLGKYSELIATCKSLLFKYPQSIDEARKSDIYNLLGLAYNYINEPYLALQAALTGVDCARAAGSFTGMANCNNTAGIVFLYSQNYPKALLHLKEVVRIEKKEKKLSSIAVCNTALVLMRLGKLKATKTYLDQALAIVNSNKSIDEVKSSNFEGAQVNSILGEYYLKIGKTGIAEKYFQLSEKYRCQHPPLQADNFYSLAVILIKRKKVASGIKLLTKAINKLSPDHTHLLEKMYKELADAHYSQRNYSKYYEFNNRYIDALKKNLEILKIRDTREGEERANRKERTQYIKNQKLQLKLNRSHQALNSHFVKRIFFKLLDLIQTNSENTYQFAKETFSLIFYTLNQNNSETHTLKDEMTFIYKYAAIMRIAYGVNFELIVKNPEGIDALIPIFALQPIIENSIIHGFLTNKNKGHIIINVSRIKNVLSIIIDDDGIGLISKTGGKHIAQAGSGLQITKERVNYLWEISGHSHKRNAFTIQPAKPKGVSVCYQIPILNEAEIYAQQERLLKVF